LTIIRLDIHDSVGKQIAADYDFQFTPTFVFLDAQGVEKWRLIGSLDTDKVLRSLEN
jgi:thioredoxin-related protein